MTVADIAVVVCRSTLGGAAPTLAGCLSSLSRAGAVSPLIVEADIPMAEIRNRALAAGTAPVVVFVDDDIEVSAGWFDALTRAWSSAGPTVGWIGGPIGLEVRGDRPAWLSDELAATRGVAPGANGAANEELPETFLGGNISFRADALAGVGGFWPARGAPGLRDEFGEEHHAQRELVRVGWEGERSKDAFATRVVSGDAVRLREVIRQRSLVGARRTLVGAGPKPGETKAATRALAGSAAAVVRVDRRLAAERLARAAGHYGAANAPKVAGGTLEPTARSTAFRFSVPAPTKGTGNASVDGAEIFCFHRVTDEAPPVGLAVTPDAFARMLDELLEERPALTLAEATGPAAASNGFAITFDDGYADNLSVALPILEEKGVPATFFIASGFIGAPRGFWWDDLARLLEHGCSANATERVLRISCGTDTRSWAPRDATQAAETRRHIVSWLQPMAPALAWEAIDQVRAWAGPGAPAPDPSDRPLTHDELFKLAGHELAAIGAHTRRHPCLSTLGPKALEEELAGSADDLGEWLGTRPDALAYPFGVWGVDVTAETCRAAATAGFRTGFVNGAGPAPATPLALSRTGIAGY